MSTNDPSPRPPNGYFLEFIRGDLQALKDNRNAPVSERARADRSLAAIAASEARLAEAREALRIAMEWAAGYPLGGDMDSRAATSVYIRAKEVLGE